MRSRPPRSDSAAEAHSFIIAPEPFTGPGAFGVPTGDWIMFKKYDCFESNYREECCIGFEITPSHRYLVWCCQRGAIDIQERSNTPHSKPSKALLPSELEWLFLELQDLSKAMPKEGVHALL